MKTIVITISNQENSSITRAKEYGPGYVQNSLGSWRQRALALQLLETKEVEMIDISSKLDVDKLSVDVLIVL